MNSNAEKIAINYLKTYDEEYATIKIDPMMIPFKELLTENGYITLHSCSAHVKTRAFRKGSKPKLELRSFHHNGSTFKKNEWYILFVAVNDICKIKNVVKNIHTKYGYDIELSKRNHPHTINTWRIGYRINKAFNYKQLYEINRNIYMEFKNEFKK